MGYEQTPMRKAIFTTNNVLAFVIGNLLVLNVLVFVHHVQQRNTAKALVFAVCQEARQETNGASEQACGDAQDALSIEYLCKANNSLASNHCWTEAK